MFIVYDLISLIFVLGCLPFYVLRRKFHSGFLIRLGFSLDAIGRFLGGRRPIWIHAVSVGEVQALKLLIERLHSGYPDKPIVISTVTSTGNKIAKEIGSKEEAVVFYLPLDFSFVVKRVIRTVNPCLFIIAETEIWPNLISCLYKRNIPIVTVNGRISDGSFLGYGLIRFLLKDVLNKINIFCVQTKTDANRLVALGLDEKKAAITGNMKFDNADYLSRKSQEESDRYKSFLKLEPQDKILVAGSTHKGEEEIILDIYKQISKIEPGIKLLLAPRNPQRAREISELILLKSRNYQPVFISSIAAYSMNSILTPIFILDIMGILNNFYRLADMVFVGGSLIKKGGHNILEPASFAKPIIFGPYMFNFRDIAELFLSNKAAISVRNKTELKESLKFLLLNPKEAAALGNRAKELVSNNRGATERNLEIIKKVIPTYV